MKEKNKTTIKEDKVKKHIPKTCYICPNCGILKTEGKILDDISAGGTDMCDCEFTRYFWNPEYDNLDVDTPRIYHEYVQISEEWHTFLKDIFNDVLRIQAFKQIPGIKRMD